MKLITSGLGGVTFIRDTSSAMISAPGTRRHEIT